jgi:hypothetical protein
MKNWKRFLAIAVLICFAVALVPVKAHADAFTAAMIGQMAYGVAAGLGITFSAGNATATGMSDFMTGQVEQYVNERGGTIASVFQGQAAVTAAGKLLMAHNLYNGITEFIGWLSDKKGLSDTGSQLTAGQYNGEFLPIENQNGVTSNGELTGVGIEVLFSGQTFSSGVYQSYAVYNGGARVTSNRSPSPGSYGYLPQFTIGYSGNAIVVYVPIKFSDGRSGSTFSTVATVSNLQNSLSWTAPPNWAAPQPLPEDKSMEQTYSGPGFAEPQDLPDFLTRIPQAIADGTLEVNDSIVDTGGNEPPPSPSPSPSPSPTPSGPKLSIADKIGILIGEIIGILYDTTGDTAQETIDQVADEVQDVTQSITDAITETQISTSGQTQTAIQQQTQTITDTMTQTQTQTQTAIQDATQTITDTITDTQTDIKDAIQDLTDTQTDIKDAIQDQTQTQEDIKDAIQDLTDVPDQWEPQKHPLPRGVFPFCIPFDLHDFIKALSAAPQTPEVHVPFDLNLPLPGGGVLPFHYQFDLDLHQFDGLAEVLRTLEFIAFGVGLLFVTGKVIKW